MSKYSELINILRRCEDQSNSEFKIVSSKLRGNTSVLDDSEIQYEDEAEGISIDLSEQNIKIFKTKVAAVKHLAEADFTKDIVIIESDKVNGSKNDTVYDCSGLYQSQPLIFENILFFYKLKSLFVNEGVASYNDETSQQLIFLSATHGRLNINYRNVWIDSFYNADNDLKNQYEIIESKIQSNSDFKDFFKESFIELSKGLPDVDGNFLQALINIKHIIDSTNRNYELFKHNFSFAEFKNQLDEDKEKYLKEYQSNLSDFLSKISSMPVQFGVYLYLMIRFSDALLTITATAILILAWTWFKVSSVNRILENIKYLNVEFSSTFSSMLEKSGINKDDVEDDRKKIKKMFEKSISLIQGYRLFSIIFSVCSLAICFYFMVELLSNV